MLPRVCLGLGSFIRVFSLQGLKYDEKVGTDLHPGIQRRLGCLEMIHSGLDEFTTLALAPLRIWCTKRQSRSRPLVLDSHHGARSARLGQGWAGAYKAAPAGAGAAGRGTDRTRVGQEAERGAACSWPARLGAARHAARHSTILSRVPILNPLLPQAPAPASHSA